MTAIRGFRNGTLVFTKMPGGGRGVKGRKKLLALGPGLIFLAILGKLRKGRKAKCCWRVIWRVRNPRGFQAVLLLNELRGGSLSGE